MKKQLLQLLVHSARTELELSAIFGPQMMALAMQELANMEQLGLVSSRRRQCHEGNNVFHWETEYYLIALQAA